MSVISKASISSWKRTDRQKDYDLAYEALIIGRSRAVVLRSL